MADNLGYSTATGATIAADDIGGVHYQRIKVVVGADGTNLGDVGPTNPIPVTGTVSVSGPVQVSGTVTAGAGTTVVSGTVSVSGPVEASGTISVSGPVQVSGTITVAPTTFTVNTAATIAGASVTIQQGASVVAQVSGAVSISAIPAVSISVSAVLGTVVTVLGTLAVSQTTVVSGAVSISALPAVSISVSAVLGTVVTVLGAVNISGAVSVSVLPAVSISVSAVLGTVVTVLGAVLVSVSALPLATMTTVGVPTQASTALIVAYKENLYQAIQIVVTSTVAEQSMVKKLFTIWTGLTGAPAAAGTTSWAVPAGKGVKLEAIQMAISSSAVLGGTAQCYIGVGATASMISASISTQLQMLKLQMIVTAAGTADKLTDQHAYIPAGESIAVIYVASTAHVIQQIVIAGYMF